MKFVDPLTSLRRFFYLVTPNETSFKTVEEVPPYVDEAVPYFVIFILVEYIINIIKGRRTVRINDGIGSMSAGVFSRLPMVFIRSVELSSYMWVHSRFCVYELPWDSAVTWFVAFLGVDFGYYWLHRIQHEVSIFWSGHQVHHSSESYDLSTALRQSVIQRFFSWIYYLPMALFVPPPIFLVHMHFNLIYQFWIHTEVVRTLGPLEWFLNTPSHHRVHHGRNPYCIDKNYGGTLIIFDRLFGTFAKEKPDEHIAYGLVHPLETFDPIEIQICHLKYLWSHVKKQETFKDKVKALLCGPGWDKGKPRLGEITDIPDISQEEVPPPFVYDPEQDVSVKIYCLIHFFIILIFFAEFMPLTKTLSWLFNVSGSSFILLSLTVFGSLLDIRDMNKGFNLEMIRLSFLFGIGVYIFVAGIPLSSLLTTVLVGTEVLVVLSAMFWLLRKSTLKITKQE